MHHALKSALLAATLALAAAAPAQADAELTAAFRDPTGRRPWLLLPSILGRPPLSPFQC